MVTNRAFLLVLAVWEGSLNPICGDPRLTRLRRESVNKALEVYNRRCSLRRSLRGPD